MKNPVLYSAVMGALFSSSQVNAEQQQQIEEEIVVISSRIELPKRQLGTSVSVLSAHDIEARGSTNLGDLLRTLPAVSVTNSGGAGKRTALQIRGESSFRTRVLIDGVDISDPSGVRTSPHIEHILSSGIERIEVLRGPQGMMYGADAGGIVNISTQRKYDDLGGSVNAEAGRFNTKQLSAELGASSEVLDFYLTGAQFETDGFNTHENDTQLRDEDGYENTSVHGRLSWHVTDKFDLEMVARDVSSESSYDACGFGFDPTLPGLHECSSDFDQTSLKFSGSYTSDFLSHHLAYQKNDIARDSLNAGSIYDTEGDITQIEYLGKAILSPSTTLVYGLDDKQEEMETTFSDQTDRGQFGVYLEYQGNFFEQLYVTAGLRHDDNDDFGEHTSYRVSGAYLLSLSESDTLKFKGNMGTGFRAPSLFEVAQNLAFAPPSEQNFSEETSEGFELGVEYFTANGLHLEAVYFDQKIEDELYFFFNGVGYYRQDQGDSQSTGVELSGRLRLTDQWALSTNYTYNDTETPDGSRRERRPRHLFNLGLNFATLSGKFTLSTNLRASRDSIDIDGSELDDYEVVDIKADYQLTSSLKAYARLENAFDEDYQEIPNYRSSGAAGYLGVRYSF